MVDLSIKPDYDVVLPEDFMSIFRPIAKEHRYNKLIEAVLKPILKPSSETEEDNLGRYVYIGQCQIRTEKKQAYKASMLESGWKPLDKAAVIAAFNHKQKLNISASMSCDWLTTNVSNIYKPFVSSVNGEVMLMKPRARTRGFCLNRFENAFYKIA